MHGNDWPAVLVQHAPDVYFLDDLRLRRAVPKGGVPFCHTRLNVGYDYQLFGFLLCASALNEFFRVFGEALAARYRVNNKNWFCHD
jgi:hypothetical protein